MLIIWVLRLNDKETKYTWLWLTWHLALCTNLGGNMGNEFSYMKHEMWTSLEKTNKYWEWKVKLCNLMSIPLQMGTYHSFANHHYAQWQQDCIKSTNSVMFLVYRYSVYIVNLSTLIGCYWLFFLCRDSFTL